MRDFEALLGHTTCFTAAWGIGKEYELNFGCGEHDALSIT